MLRKNHLGKLVQDWNPEQKAAQSRRKRPGGLVEQTPKGRRHYELVFHIRNSSHYEWTLAYEAYYLNDLSLEEWLSRLRVGGELTGKEIFLPPFTYVTCLDGNWSNTDKKNLYCFLTKKARLEWKKNPPKAKSIDLRLFYPNNLRQVYTLASEYTLQKKNAQAAKFTYVEE